MTSLLRDDVPVPIAFAASATITSWPAIAAARPMARPTTPAPTTRTCMRPEYSLTFVAAAQHYLRHCVATASVAVATCIARRQTQLPHLALIERSSPESVYSWV